MGFPSSPRLGPPEANPEALILVRAGFLGGDPSRHWEGSVGGSQGKEESRYGGPG